MNSAKICGPGGRKAAGFKRRKEILVDLEQIFLDVREALVYDLMNSREIGHFARGMRSCAIFNWNVGPDLFKRFQQCNLFDKRIIWSYDKSFDELSKEAFAGFIDSQKSFHVPEPMSLRETLVIQEAARIVKDVLGEFSVDTWLDSCTFGKRAAVDLPRAISYLDTRMDLISGSPEQIGWFRACLCRDVHLLRAVRQRKTPKQYRRRIRTKATAVPKSFKSARIVFPPTIIGGFLSRGLGEMIRTLLEKGTRIDLAKQQERHRVWAKEASVNGLSATIDMRKASDSFVRRHIELLVPESWHDALDVVRTRKCKLGSVDIDLVSVMLMGDGHTFPLQTLLFYSLAEAVRILMKVRGRVSVYGDDIILPTRIARPFIEVMERLGFTINSEKSFVNSHDPDMPSQTLFRESCGGDYKGGVDVRPYMPECDLQENGKVPRNEAVAWCHKLINGLLDRWSVEELPLTCTLLLQTIVTRCKRDIHFVPEMEPDHSGIRHVLPSHTFLGLPVHRPTIEGSWAYYRKLTQVFKTRVRDQRERPYYWYALKQKSLMRELSVYDTPVSTQGERLRSDKGQYRWKTNRDLSREILAS